MVHSFSVFVTLSISPSLLVTFSVNHALLDWSMAMPQGPEGLVGRVHSVRLPVVAETRGTYVDPRIMSVRRIIVTAFQYAVNLRDDIKYTRWGSLPSRKRVIILYEKLPSKSEAITTRSSTGIKLFWNNPVEFHSLTALSSRK